jgi:hypothetical protein
VWWLIEDGGLVFLLAYLMSRHREYKRDDTKLRLFGLVSMSASANDLEKERERLTTLLHRFRFDAVVILVQYDVAPPEKEIEAFSSFVGIDVDRIDMNEETRTILNVSHQLKAHSHHAHAIMISLPVPKVQTPDRTYFAYLEMLSCTGRPTFIARGNQQTVLSIHS